MSLVDAETGEIVVGLDAESARNLTDRIKVAVEGTWLLVKEAYEGRAWVPLGYSSWDDYCTREFGTSRLKLPREERQEVVASLRESGLSIRAIAAATGEGVATVKRVLDSGVPNGTPALTVVDAGEPFGSPADSNGFDLTPAEIDPETGDLPGQPEDDRRTIGTDGKSYAKDRQAVRARRRRIRELAEQGWTTPNIARELGMSTGGVTNAIRQMGVKPPPVVKRARRDGLVVVAKAMDSLAAVAMAAEAADVTGVDEVTARRWMSEIEDAVRHLGSLKKRLKVEGTKHVDA